MRPTRTTTERGYGSAHKRTRRDWVPIVEAGGVQCARCHRLISPYEPWDLGHDDHDRTLYQGPEHRRCNRGAPSRRRGRLRRRQPPPETHTPHPSRDW